MSENTKKYFGTDGIRGHVGDALMTPDFILKLGWAAGKVFARDGGGKVLIGKDTRISGYMFESALEAGLSAAGMDINLLGPMPTPAIAYLTRTLRAQAGIVISASHNAYYDNGIKFFSADGTKLADDVEAAIETQLERPLTTVDSKKLGKAVRLDDAPGRYIEFCKSTISSSIRLNGIKIVVDCANGATYHVAGNVFRELGATVIEIGVDPNGFNINAGCGSTSPDILREIVLQEEADLGIALDGDGDRVVMVDNQGDIVDGDELVYVIAKYYKARKELQGGVVGTVMSNLGLEQALKEMELEFVRTKVGDRHIVAQLKKRNWILGGESSGHIICAGANLTGDGIVSSLQVLAAIQTLGQSLNELKKGMTKHPQTTINVSIQEPFILENHSLVSRAIKQIEQQLQNKGRVLLRCSGTEPVVRVMVEANNEALVETYAKQLAEVVKESIS